MGGSGPLNFGRRFNPAQNRGGNAAARPVLNRPNPAFQFRPPNNQRPLQQNNPLLQLIALLNQIAAAIQLIQQQQAGAVQPARPARPARPAAPPRPPAQPRPAAPPRSFDDFWKVSDQTQRDIDAYRPRVTQTTGIMDQVRAGTPVEDVLKTVPDQVLSLITARPVVGPGGQIRYTSSMVDSLTAAVQLVDQTTANLNDRITVLNQLLPLTQQINATDAAILAKQQDIANADNELQDYRRTFNSLTFDIDNDLWPKLQRANQVGDNARSFELRTEIANRLNTVFLASGIPVILPLVDPGDPRNPLLDPLGPKVTKSLKDFEDQITAKEADLAQLNANMDTLNQERAGIERRQADAALLLGIPFDDNAKAFLSEANNLNGAIQALEHAKALLPKDTYDQGLADAKALLQYRDQIEREWQRRRDLNLPDPGIRPAPPVQPVQIVQADPQPLPVVDPVPPRIVVQANPIPINPQPARIDVQPPPNRVEVVNVNVNLQPDSTRVVMITPTATPQVTARPNQIITVTPTPVVVVT